MPVSSWYEQQRKIYRSICATVAIRLACPLACGTKQTCWEGHLASVVSPYTIWHRIMRSSEHRKGAGIICAREGIDLIQRCHDNKARPGTSSAPGATGWESVGDFGPLPFMDVDINNCETLSQVVDPHCSFATIPKKINLEIKANGGYSIEFWIKILPGTLIPVDNVDWQNRPEAMRRIVFFSNVSPLRVIASLEFRSNFLDTQLKMYGTCSTGDTEEINIVGKYETGVWYHVAAILGGKNADGKVGQIVMQGSSSAFDFADWGWCQV